MSHYPNATSPPNRRVLPDALVSRVFERMEALYGSLFIDRWKDTDIARVRAVWAEELGGFADAPEMIAHALRSLSACPMPPTLPEFLVLCRSAPRPQLFALPEPPTNRERQHEQALAVGAAVLAPGGDAQAWAKVPRSAKAWHLLLAGAAEGDSGLRAILRGHIEAARVPPALRERACEVFVG